MSAAGATKRMRKRMVLRNHGEILSFPPLALHTVGSSGSTLGGVGLGLGSSLFLEQAANTKLRQHAKSATDIQNEFFTLQKHSFFQLNGKNTISDSIMQAFPHIQMHGFGTLSPLPHYMQVRALINPQQVEYK